jgi:hypothetical protein
MVLLIKRLTLIVLFSRLGSCMGLSIPTTTDEMVTIEILGVYAPANESDKHVFWTQFSTYLLACLQRIANNDNHHLIMVGDWNSYIDVERDIYRENISSTIPSTTTNTTSHLQQLMDMLAYHHFYLYDPISRDKFAAYDSYTYLANNGNFRSILDKMFTSFSSEHCDKSIILDWDAYNNMNLSDHRAVNVDNRTADQVDRLKSLVYSWKSELPSNLAAHLLSHSQSPLTNVKDAKVIDDLLEEMHAALTRLFVDLPNQAFRIGSCNRHKVYKSAEAGGAQHVVTWLHRYKIALRTLF